jgi:RNA polymerase sigma-70 factor (ECF subfamily)
MMGSAEDAEDVLQDTFVRAFEKLDQFHGESSFYTWAYRIAVNLALSGHRRRRVRAGAKRELELFRGAVTEPVDLSPEADPTSRLERVERERMVEWALNQLGPEHRAVVILKDFDGRRYEEISELLSIPIGTVRSRLHRARLELRERLRGLVGNDASVHEGTSSVN